jgi:hypothetical protein
VFDVDGATNLSKSVQPASGGAPRWTYVIGAIVGAASLFWTVTSYFVSHSRNPEPASLEHSLASSITVSGSGPAASTQVTVTGQGVRVSQMNGGTIQTGLSREEVALIKATVEELVSKLTPHILEGIVAQQGRAYRQSTSIGVVESSPMSKAGRSRRTSGLKPLLN